MTIAAHTGRAETRPCDRCGAAVEHRESILAPSGQEKALWLPERHEAPCGLPCMGGGVHPRHVRQGGAGAHGYQDRCPRCGPLRVLPEVVAMMRKRATSLLGLTKGNYLGDRADEVANDLLRAIDEIATLRRERDAARQSRDDARERATFAELELQDREVAAEEARAEASPPVDLAWLSDAQRAEATTWIARQVEGMRAKARDLRLVGEAALPDEALRLEGLAATLLAMVSQHDAAPLAVDSAENRRCS